MSAKTRYLTLLTLAICITFRGHVQAQSDGGATLWKFFGIPQGFRRVRDGLSNRRGNHPGLERKPPLKALADPANLESEVEAIKAAAEIKQAEDLKKQKIKAIKYLAEIGCGCYDKDGKVSDALAAALDDCTEDVRMATVESIQEAAGGECCSQCGSKSCCKEKVVLQLARLAYERDDKGCWVEPSERVRQAAAEALAVCCPSQAPVEVIAPKTEEIETPETPETPNDVEIPEAPEGIEANRSANFPYQSLRSISMQRASNESSPQPLRELVVSDRNNVTLEPTDALSPVSSEEPVHGAVVWVDTRAGMAHVHFAQEGHSLPVGTTMRVYRRMLNGDLRPIGQLAIAKATSGGANVHAAAGTDLSRYRRGDVVMMATESRSANTAAQASSPRPSRAQLTLVEWLQK